MSTTVDRHLVEMQFSNSQFESGVSTSISSLERLKQALNLSDSAKSFDDVEQSSRKVKMESFANAVDTIKHKFSALEIIGTTALMNIANSATNMAKRVVSSLTIDPIKTGFNEYETKMGSIQTIMSNTASKGTTMKDVTETINELNTYADKTIYNFSEMTRNIGTFTAAGLGLKESAADIQGIANLAAASGSTSQQASTAMYQLSQALAAGKIQLMDWNSVVNAGMGGEKFQEALKATARDHGIAVDAIIEKTGSFRESLHSGWISAEVMSETLQKFTVKGATEYSKSMMESGKWTQAQADALIKEAHAMEDAATKVKTFTQLCDTLKEAAQSGWGQTWEIIVGDFEEAKAFFTDVSDTIGGIIGKAADARNSMLQGWKDLGGRAKLIDILWNSFNGVMKIISSIGKAFREVFPRTTSEQLFSATEKLSNLSKGFENLANKLSGPIYTVFKGFFDIVAIGRDIFVNFVKAISNFSGLIDPIINGLSQGGTALGNWLSSLRDATIKTDIIGKSFSALGRGIAFTIDHILELGNKIAGAFYKIGSSIVNFISSTKIASISLSGVASVFNTGIFATLIMGLTKFVNSGGNLIKNLSKSANSLTNVFKSVRESLQLWQESIRANTILKIAGAIGILAVSLALLASIDAESMAVGIAGMTAVIGELSVAMKHFDAISRGGGFGGIAKLAASMISLSTSVLILSGALKLISSMSINELVVGLSGLAGVSAILVVASKSIFNSSKRMIKGAGGLISISIAIGTLALSLKLLSTFNWNELLVGLTGLSGIMVTLALFTKAISGSKILTVGIGLIAVSTAITVLSGAMKIFATMSWTELAKSLIAVGGSLGIFAAGLALMHKAIPGAAALLIASGALAVLVPSILLLGNSSLATIGTGLVGIAGAFAVFGLAGIALQPVVPTLIALAGAVAMFGAATFGVGAGIALLAAGLAGLAVSGAGAVASLSLVLSSIISFIPMVIEQIGLGLISIANVIAGSAEAIAGAFTAIILGITNAISNAGPRIIEVVIDLVTTLLVKLAESMPKIVESGIQIVLSLLEGIRQHIAEVVTVAVDIVLAFIGGLMDQIPKVVSSAFEFILSLINGMADAVEEYTPKIVESVFNLGEAIIQGIIDGIFEAAKGIGSTILGVGESIITGFKDILGIHSPSKVMKDEVGHYIVQGIAEGIKEDMSAEEAAQVKAKNIADAFKAEFDAIDLRLQSNELEYKLFKAINPDNTSGELQFLNDKKSAAGHKAELAYGEYENMLNTFGADHDETIKAYNNFLQYQIELKDIEASISKAHVDISNNSKLAIEANKDSYLEYINWMTENSEYLLGLGYSIERISKVAAERTGYNPDMPAIYSEAGLTEAGERDAKTYTDSAITGIKSQENGYKSAGQAAIEAYASGIESSASKAVNAAVNVAEQVANNLNSTTLESNDHVSTSSKGARPVIQGSRQKIEVEKLWGTINGVEIQDYISGKTAKEIASIIGANPADLIMPSNDSKTVNNSTVVYNQTINSPKHISRAEIHHDTKSLLSQKFA